MLMEAVSRAANTDDINRVDIETIENLICTARNKPTAVKCLAMIIKKMPLSKYY
jgi:hypothetical protein